MATWNGIELDELVLESDRLILRPPRLEDARDVLAAVEDPAMRDFLALPKPYTHAEAEHFVRQTGHEGRQDGTGVGAVLIERSSGRLVGSAALRLPSVQRRQASIGYAIYPVGRGRGYAADATRTLCGWGFARGLARIELDCSVRNVASVRTAQLAGFSFEGVARDRAPRTTGGVEDLARFARLSTDDGRPIAASFVPMPSDALSDGVVALRPTNDADADARLEEETDPFTVGWSFYADVPTRDEVTRESARAGLDWLVGRVALISVVDTASGRYAGHVTLRQAGPPGVGGIGYGVHPDFRGRGYTTRALRLLIPWAFEQADFARLELGCKVHNVGSQKAALAAGFSPDHPREQRLRNRDGSYGDELRFVLLNPSTARRDQVVSLINP